MTGLSVSAEDGGRAVRGDPVEPARDAHVDDVERTVAGSLTQGDTLAALGEILSLSDRLAEAAAAFEQAAGHFERKGNSVSLERVRALAAS